MSFANFKPNVWAAGINRELARKCVFVEDCYQKFNGKVTKKGESVTILGIGSPTITTISKDSKNKNLGTPEVVEDTSVILYIDQLSYFNYQIDDIDEAQSSEDIDGTLSAETSDKLANEVDKFIGSKVVDPSVPKLYKDGPVKVVAKETETAGEKYVLDVMDDAVQVLQENDVADSTPIIVTVSPRFFKIFKKAYRFEDTNNSGILKNGKVGMYDKVTVKRSNNVHRTAEGSTAYAKDGAVDHIMIRTQRAVAFAKPHTFTEALRSTDWFCDVIRGYILYGAKIIRPKEILDINVKY